MRILYFADIRFPLERANGIQTMETCYALAEIGHEVRLVVRPDTHEPARDPFEFYGLRANLRLTIERATAPAGGGALQRIGYLAFMLGRAFGTSQADVIVTRDLGVASAVLRLPRGLRAPVVYESHGYAPEVAAALPELVATAVAPGRAKLKRLERREAHVWKAADGYVTITQALADDLAQRFGSRPRLTVAPDGARLDMFAPTAMPDEPVVGYAGHLYAWKGVDVLLRALARVPRARGLIVGGHQQESDLGRARALAAELGISHRVTFTAQLPRADVAARLAEARVLVLPNPASAISSRYTSPLKLFEYLMAGRTIVASDLPAIREVLRDGENALLVPPGNVEAMAAAIQRVLDDQMLGERLARAAAATAPSYTWTRRARRLEALLDEVASSRA